MAPQLLAFPYHETVGADDIWSEKPIDRQALTTVLADADRRLASSPLERPASRHIFLTDGGWRWRWLALSASGGFAMTRPIFGPLIINVNRISTNQVWNGQAVGGVRSLSGILAHETTHLMIRWHFGLLTALTAPTWLVEGYCDHVADESSLSAQQVSALEARGEAHPALVYFHGRRQVEAILAANGGSVDRLFAEN